MQGIAQRTAALLAADGSFPSLLGRGDSVPAQAACVLPGTQDQTAPIRRRRTTVDAVPVETFRLEECPDQCKAGHLDRLAQEGVPAVLAVEVPRRQTPTAKEHSALDCRDGNR